MDDLAALMDPALTLPISGHTYTVECTAHQGLHLRRLFATPDLILTDTQERVEILQMLGDTHQQMVDNGIGWPRIVIAGRTAMFWFGISPEVATRYWNTAGGLAPGNPIPPSPHQTAMGEKLRAIFQRPATVDRTILTATR